MGLLISEEKHAIRRSLIVDSEVYVCTVCWNCMSLCFAVLSYFLTEMRMMTEVYTARIVEPIIVQNRCSS